jgi:hypothetical protein
MSAEMGCDQVRELAPELALGIAAGEERDAALRHVTGCLGCRRLVSELSSVGEDLLLLAPPQEPPAGFEARVLDALAPSPRRTGGRSGRRRSIAAAVLAAAVLVSIAVGGWSVFMATAGDRRLAESYQAALAVGRGSFFASAPISGPEGRAGTVFGYEGQPSWVVLTMGSGTAAQAFRIEAVTDDGRVLPLGEETLGGGDVWASRLPVALSTVRELRFEGTDGSRLIARFAPPPEWR